MGYISKLAQPDLVLINGVGPDHAIEPGFEYRPGSPPEGWQPYTPPRKLSATEAMAQIAELILPLPDEPKGFLLPVLAGLRQSLEFGDVPYVQRQLEAMALPELLGWIKPEIMSILAQTEGAE